MKVSGFTFIRNAVKYDFPVVEAITSILPVVDEFVVNVGKSEDDTLGLIQAIQDPRIKIVENVWDESLQKDGEIFGIQQDIALSHCTGDWAFLVQGDEVIHEEDLPTIRQAMAESFPNPDVLGLVLRVLHFKGDYWSLDPWMYRKATRIIRNHRGIRSTTDCCDFRTAHNPQMLKSGRWGRVIPARVYHYGWVKSSEILIEKLVYQDSRHSNGRKHDDDVRAACVRAAHYPTYPILKNFTGTHPKVMNPRVEKTQPLASRRNRWLNWRFYREVLRHGFKG